jgi:hypothetical protein
MMVTSVEDKVHPWYKGNHEWKVKNIVKLERPIEYYDETQKDVRYDPKILNLAAPTGCSVLWFTYWISTIKTEGKMKWGQGPPILEESVLLELMKKAINGGLFSEDFLSVLAKEIQKKLKV